MGFTLANKYPADDPAPLYRYCLQHGLRTDHFYRRANSWSNPLTVPGTGTLILPRDTLDSLDLAGGDTFRTLTISDGGNTLKIAKVLIVGHELAATPGYAGDAPTQYVVQIADPRYLVWDRGTPVTKSYNLRTDADGSYVTSTLNAGTAWTWQQILADLWPTSVLGAAPTLPFTPDGTPEGFWFQHAYPLNAVAFFLTRLCCGIKYDQINDVYTIVRLGDTADASAAALTTFTAKNAKALIYDGYPVTPYLASLPATVRVEFRVRAPYTDGTPPYYTIDKTITPAAPAVNAAVLSLQDDLTALQTNGTVTNSAALGTRATERATHWTAKRVNHDTALHREYDGLFDATSTLGCYVAAIRWADFEAGVRTSVAAGNNADRRVEDWQRPLMTGETLPGVGIWGAPLIVGPLDGPTVCCCCGMGATGSTTATTKPPGGTTQTMTGTLPPVPGGTITSMVGGFGAPPTLPPSATRPPGGVGVHCPPGQHLWYDPITGTLLGCQPNDPGGGGPRGGRRRPFKGLTQIIGDGRGFRGARWIFPAEIVAFATLTKGDVLVYDSASPDQFSVVSAGTAGQVWTSNGPGALPTYQPAGGGGSSATLVGTPSDLTAQTTTQNVATYTVGGANETVRVGWYLLITAIAGFGNSITPSVNFTDVHGVAQTIQPEGVSPFTTVGAFAIRDVTFRAKAGTSVAAVITVVGTVTYDGGGTAEKAR